MLIFLYIGSWMFFKKHCGCSCIPFVYWLLLLWLMLHWHFQMSQFLNLWKEVCMGMLLDRILGLYGRWIFFHTTVQSKFFVNFVFQVWVLHAKHWFMQWLTAMCMQTGCFQLQRPLCFQFGYSFGLCYILVPNRRNKEAYGDRRWETRW